jgi:hypothetical protein
MKMEILLFKAIKGFPNTNIFKSSKSILLCGERQTKGWHQKVMVIGRNLMMSFVTTEKFQCDKKVTGVEDLSQMGPQK